MSKFAENPFEAVITPPFGYKWAPQESDSDSIDPVAEKYLEDVREIEEATFQLYVKNGYDPASVCTSILDAYTGLLCRIVVELRKNGFEVNLRELQKVISNRIRILKDDSGGFSS